MVLVAGPDFGDLKAYNLTNKSLNPDKEYGMLIKTKNKMTLPKAERDKLAKLMTDCESANEKKYMRVQLILSPDFAYAIAVYQNLDVWVPFLYNIYHGRRLGSYLCQLTGEL